MMCFCVTLQSCIGTYRPESPQMFRKSLIATALVVAFTVPVSAWAQSATPAGDAAAGAKKTQMCAGCHGILGWRTAYPEVYKVPKIGGQHAAYIIKALGEYKSGERNHPSMRAIAASLSEQDMADLAAYYAAGAAMTASK